MKKTAGTLMILAAGVFVLLLLTAGCEEQNSSDTRMSRLVAAENMQLKKDLQQRDKEIEKQKELLAQCLEEKEKVSKQVQQEFEKMGKNALNDFETILKFQEENEKLRNQLEELRKELEKSQ